MSQSQNQHLWRQEIAAFFIFAKQMSVVQLFFGEDFILSEFTDNYFEVETVLCLDFYASRDVFRRNGMVQQDRIVGNRYELREIF